MNKFEDAFISTLNNEVSVTENGACGYKTSGKSLLDLNFSLSSLRSKSDEDVVKAFSAAFFENRMLSLKWLFMARDIRGGCGERRVFRTCFKWLAEFHQDIARALVPVVSNFGRWDDLWCLLDTKISKNITDLVFEQLSQDLEAKKNGKSISLLAKWLPSVNSSSAGTKSLAKKIRIALGMDEKTYRKTLSSLRSYSNVVEVAASANRWSEIDYNKVPSKANLKYKNAFLRNDEDRRRKWLSDLQNGKAKINSSASFPSDIVHAYASSGINAFSYRRNASVEDNVVLEEMWKALPDYTSGSKSGSTIVVADSSGSMTIGTGNSSSMTALEVCYSLAIYFAEKLNGPFKDKVITFSERPKYLDLSKCKSLGEKLNYMYSQSEVANTNVERVFDLILKTAIANSLSQDDIPSNVLICSDMEFDAAQGMYYCGSKYSADQDALFKRIEKKWMNAGYKLPRLVFWNIASRTGTIPLQSSSNGVALLSGYSPAIANMVFSTKLDPYEVLVDALNAKRYDIVEKLVKDLI